MNQFPSRLPTKVLNKFPKLFSKHFTGNVGKLLRKIRKNVILFFLEKETTKTGHPLWLGTKVFTLGPDALEIGKMPPVG